MASHFPNPFVESHTASQATAKTSLQAPARQSDKLLLLFIPGGRAPAEGGSEPRREEANARDSPGAQDS